MNAIKLMRGAARGMASGLMTPLLRARPDFRSVVALCTVALTTSASWSSILVTAGGQASSAIAIAVPPGIGGMAPQLALTYVDGGPSGPVGSGWSLQGISIITRCPSTRAVDGFGRNIDFSSKDHLCLDGQRLIQTNASGAPVADHSSDASGLAAGQHREFRTEKDSFARIRAYGAANGGLNNGPLHFRVWTKSGQVYDYGATADADNSAQALVTAATSFEEQRTGSTATVVAVWAVRKVSDTSGNYIDFRYEQRSVTWGSTPVGTAAPQAREWNPIEIRYTGNGSQLPANRVVFDYVDRAIDVAVPSTGFDRSEAYQFDRKNVSVRLLTAIRTAVGQGSVPVALYKLQYARSPLTGRSQLTSFAQCSGRVTSSCLPATTMTYNSAGALAPFSANSSFALGPLARLALLDMAGTTGVLSGDFFGTGRTDILRWSSVAANNQLWRSIGQGSFEAVNLFNISSDTLFGSNGCLSALVADFNGDGLSDILRTTQAACSAEGNLLFINRGDGTFERRTLPAAIRLEQRSATTTISTIRVCPERDALTQGGGLGAVGPALQVDRYGPRRVPTGPGGAVGPAPDGLSGTCIRTSRTEGRRFYVLDLDGDGVLDLVSTTAMRFVWYSGWGPIPTEEALCNGGVDGSSIDGPCTRVYKGDGNGGFTEYSNLSVGNQSLYSHPPRAGAQGVFWRLPELADIDGDGLTDILSSVTGNWRSLGNGDFAPSEIRDSSQVCALPIDFNGDGRSDCLNPAAAGASQTLTLSFGAANSGPLSQFNLTALSDPLAVFVDGSQTVGVVVCDFDGDGRQDILRWGAAAPDNGIYLSNGDGSFRGRQGAGLQTLARPLRAADGATAFVLGDFLGNGTHQILHLKHNPPGAGGDEAALNQLYEMVGFAGPKDVLTSITSGTGLTSSVTSRVPLTTPWGAGGRYVADRGTARAAVAPMVDLTMPLYVVATLKQDTGGGGGASALVTEYLYAGLKAERGGRGLLGFRELQQASPTPTFATLNVVTEYLQPFPFTGVAASSNTYVGALGCNLPGSAPCAGATPLSSTTNTYCDRVGGSVQGEGLQSQCNLVANLAFSPRVRRPYLLKSVESGRDLLQPLEPLPSVTTVNYFNDFGDPVRVEVTTVAVGAVGAAGPAYKSTKFLTNDFCAADDVDCPNRIAGDAWIIGRLKGSVATNSVTYDVDLLTAAAGSNPYRPHNKGSGPLPAPLPPPALKTGALAAIINSLLND